MNALFDAATDELHDHLSAWAHGTPSPSPGVVVRRLLPGSNTITIDVVGASARSVDRFEVAFRPNVVGNRSADGVNLANRKRPAAITATAGTLSTTRREATLHSTEALRQWMRDTVQVCNL